MAENSIYSKAGGETYFYDDNNKLIGSAKGDQRGNQSFALLGESTGSRLKPTVKAESFMKQTGKDITTDMATQLPLAMIPGEGIGMKILRQLGSLAGGYGTDRLLNPEKPQSDSLSDATFNQVIGNLIPRLITNPPDISQFDKARGYGVRGIMGGLIKSLQGSPAIDKVLPAMPVVRGAGGRMVSNKVKYKEYMDYLQKKKVLDNIAQSAGFGVNAGIDLLNNFSNK